MVRTFLAIMLFALTFIVYGWIETKSDKTKYNILSTVLLFTFVCFFIPDKYYLNIPFIGYGTIGNFANEIFSAPELSALVELDDKIYSMTLDTVASITKVALIYIVDSLTLLISGIVFYFKDKANGDEPDDDHQGIKTLILSFLTIFMFMVPVNSVLTLTYTTKNIATNEGQDVIEEYPSFEKYSGFIRPAIALANVSNAGILNTNYATYFLLDSNNTFTNYLDELNKANDLLIKLQESGMDKIFTDPNFRFSNLKKGDINFSKLKELAKQAEECEMTSNVGLTLANEILGSLEKEVKKESGTSRRVVLELTPRQYKQDASKFIELFEFAIEYDVVKKISHKPLSVLKDLILDKGFMFSIGLLKVDIIEKLMSYFKGMSKITGGVYLCARLYDFLDEWLIDFKQTDMFKIAQKFLLNKAK